MTRFIQIGETFLNIDHIISVWVHPPEQCEIDDETGEQARPVAVITLTEFNGGDGGIPDHKTIRHRGLHTVLAIHDYFEDKADVHKIC